MKCAIMHKHTWICGRQNQSIAKPKHAKFYTLGIEEISQVFFLYFCKLQQLVATCWSCWRRGGGCAAVRPKLLWLILQLLLCLWRQSVKVYAAIHQAPTHTHIQTSGHTHTQPHSHAAQPRNRRERLHVNRRLVDFLGNWNIYLSIAASDAS